MTNLNDDGTVPASSLLSIPEPRGVQDLDKDLDTMVLAHNAATDHVLRTLGILTTAVLLLCAAQIIEAAIFISHLYLSRGCK